MRRLNWGCGPEIRDGWENSDLIDYGHGQQHVGDITAGLPYDDGWFDYAVSHHVLQMIAWPDLVPTLVELRRVITAVGWLRLSVPSLHAAMNAWARNDRSWFPIDDRHEESVDGKFCMYVTQAGATRSVFTLGWLLELLGRAGFSTMCPCRAFETSTGIDDLTALDSRRVESLYVDARR